MCCIIIMLQLSGVHCSLFSLPTADHKGGTVGVTHAADALQPGSYKGGAGSLTHTQSLLCRLMIIKVVQRGLHTAAVLADCQ